MSFHPLMDYGRAHHKSSRTQADEGPPFTFTAEHLATLEDICSRYPAQQRKSAVLAALYLAQRQQGYVSRNAIKAVAAAIRCTTAEVEEVVSFYTMFYQRPVGRHVLQVCRTLSCALNGAERVTEELQKVLGITPGNTTEDGEFSLFEVECLGACDRAPVVGVNDHWHECHKPEDAKALVDGLKATGVSTLTGCHLHKERAQ
ncbi:MAG: NADH-quinone oxidoreductase subunit NuoE [Acidobacteria bacterium]|jgi:NADH-quinone oxidoreductase E subunit|nr:NADH-quinone oxidoreductase subunit NuoE [Acidobacteriota bacterium]